MAPLDFDSVKADMSRFFIFFAMVDIIKIKMLPALIIGIKIKRKIHKWCVISRDPFHSRIETQIELGLGLTPYTKTHSHLNRF